MQETELPLALRVRAKRDPRYGVEFYEGLVRKTAARIEPYVEEDFDDLCSLYRIKVWRALESFDQSKSRVPVERYVFSCVMNLSKDLGKKMKRNFAYIEDFTSPSPEQDQAHHAHGDKFIDRYLSVDDDDVFSELPSWDSFTLPATLVETEVKVLVLLYQDYGYAEVALRLGITKREVTVTAKSIRDKMEDWRPTRQADPAPAAPPASARQTVASPSAPHAIAA